MATERVSGQRTKVQTSEERRAAGRVQISVWLSSEAAAALKRLVRHWKLRWPKLALERVIVEADKVEADRRAEAKAERAAQKDQGNGS